jgi:alpha-amylase/alpha-mannosidase (GH57 family)
MERYICIHCHFYQPPRENPWLEAIEQQDSAYPFHDWNERITAECYAPNGASRVLDREGYITRIVNNYSRISFNFGPTLLSWLEAKMPEVYRSILDADQESQRRFSGHGSAIAQVYNHMILPLANAADKFTQIYWGKKDFEHRFGRAPEGMWLAETAVDLQTLDLLAKQGIKYTILAPRQAGKVRRLHGGGRWKDIGGGEIDPTRAYLQKLPSGRSIALFFYDGPISQAVAFERLLDSGENFANRLLSGFNEHRHWPQLMHIATDGESYGHHHSNGDMALAYALKHIEENELATLTNYGEYLAKHPPTMEVQVMERTAWSCSHGVERWNSDCGCNSGREDWNQKWRLPLRQALDWLRDETSRRYEYAARPLLKDPWAARNDYIEVILDRAPESRDRFFAKHQARPLQMYEQVKALKLLELQRHAMLMYTSCGWFFDEITGIETVQVIQYAGRVIQLAEDLFADAQQLEEGFLSRLAEAKSNLPEHQNGAEIYRRSVKPSAIGLKQIVAHHAIRSMVKAGQENGHVYCYEVQPVEVCQFASGRVGLAAGVVKVCSRITQEQEVLSYGVIHFGDHNINAGVREFRGEQSFQTLLNDLTSSFNQADLPTVIRLLDQHFNGVTYSLKSLVGDEQKRILNAILNSTMQEAEASFQIVYEHHASLIRYLAEQQLPLPDALRTTAQFVVDASLRRALESDFINLDQVRMLVQETRQLHLSLDQAGVGYALANSITRLMQALREEPENTGLMQKLIEVLNLVRQLGIPVDLWRPQNLYYEMLRHVEPKFRSDTEAQEWGELFRELGDKLRMRLERMATINSVLAAV